MKKWEVDAGIALALSPGVSETAERLIYDEPTVMWRMQRTGGLSTHAVIGPHLNGAILVWFVNDRPAGYRQFTDLTDALHWSEQLKAQNWAIGWRVVPE